MLDQCKTPYNAGTHVGSFWIDPNYGSMADAFEVKCIKDYTGIGTCIRPSVADLVRYSYAHIIISTGHVHLHLQHSLMEWK